MPVTGPLSIVLVYESNRSFQERRGPAPAHYSHVPQMNTDMRSVPPLSDERVRNRWQTHCLFVCSTEQRASSTGAHLSGHLWT